MHPLLRRMDDKGRSRLLVLRPLLLGDARNSPGELLDRRFGLATLTLSHELPENPVQKLTVRHAAGVAKKETRTW